MSTHPALALIEQRISANHFDPGHVLQDTEIEALVRLATRAPTAYHLQNWRFIAVRTPEAKARLRAVAQNQRKVVDAAVTFIIVGLPPDHDSLSERLRPFVEHGFMSEDMVAGWREGARLQYADAQTARDEAVRTATFGAATLIHAAQALGLASGPMVGFDPEGVRREFGLQPHEVPVVLVAVGRAAPGNWPQKPRRPLPEILDLA